MVQGFDRLAPVYDALASVAFAGRIHASQVALLPCLPPVERALVVGGGTGRFLAEFLASDGAAHAVAIDASPEMTRRTARRLERLGQSDRVDLRVGGLERLAAHERFDVVATHCFLDLFDEPELAAVMTRLRSALAPGGLWLWSDFSHASRGLPGLAQRAVVAGLYAFFRATCGISARRLPDFEGAFARAGLETLTHQPCAGGLLQAAICRGDA